MTRPDFTRAVSLGNVISLVIILATGAMAWATQRAETSQIRQDVDELKIDRRADNQARQEIRETLVDLKAELRFIRLQLDQLAKGPSAR